MTADDIRAMSQWLIEKSSTREIAFPARARADAGFHRRAGGGGPRRHARRDGEAHGNTAKINPLVPVDLVIDHSVMVDSFGNARAFEINVDLEYQRNKERYEFLRWGSALSRISALCLRGLASAIR